MPPSRSGSTRAPSEPDALVMFGDDVIGRSRIPNAERADLRAAARDGLFATGSLEVDVSGGLLLVDCLVYDGLAGDEDDEDDED